MRSRSTGAQPARFEAVRRRFELWRRTRQGRARIPERRGWNYREMLELAGTTTDAARR